MIKVYTIGFTGKSAREFFELLKGKDIEKLVDIRLSNTSQLAGFTKKADLEYFVNEICGIEYKHDLNFAPEKYTLDRYRKGEIDWERYTKEFAATMYERRIKDYMRESYAAEQIICLLCSEPTPECCHRRLIAEYFEQVFEGMEIIHL